jgi:hypothetical protein
MRRLLVSHELDDPPLPRKAPVESTAGVTVPQTDTGGFFFIPSLSPGEIIKSIKREKK